MGLRGRSNRRTNRTDLACRNNTGTMLALTVVAVLAVLCGITVSLAANGGNPVTSAGGGIGSRRFPSFHKRFETWHAHRGKDRER